MGKATGKLERRICSCGKKTRNSGKDSQGRTRYGILCVSCHRSYKYNKKKQCEQCNFIPIHGVQLEIDHIDGNKRNNSLDNLQTLCCNCHRLKTYANDEWNNQYE